MTFGASSALEPAGREAAHLAELWWIFLGISAVVYAAVMVALAIALVRRDDAAMDVARRRRVVEVCTLVTTVVLFGLVFVSVRAGRAIAVRPGEAALLVKVTGRQWWWQFEYVTSPPSQMVSTANELHLPVGVPVELQLASRDVIHSFWVPALHGKRDLIPGHDSITRLTVERPGIFHGQCAEFCGDQHARMAFLVVAEPAADFQAWLEAQRKPAPPPRTPEARRGQELFLRGNCSMCHAVSGTPAGGRLGPDLTHLAARRTIAAATRPRSGDDLARWIRDPHGIKPGVRMPPSPLPPDALASVVAYLESLR